MKVIEQIILTIIISVLACAVSYYYGVGSGYIEAYEKACRNYTQSEWRELWKK